MVWGSRAPARPYLAEANELAPMDSGTETNAARQFTIDMSSLEYAAQPDQARGPDGQRS